MGGIRRIYEQHYWQTWLKIQRERQTVLEQRAIRLDIEWAFFKAKQRQAELEERYNHNHDPRTGRFVSNNSLTGNNKSDNIKISGGISGAINRYTKEAQRHAAQYYEAVRHMKTDVSNIAKNTGFSEQEIQEVKNFIFLEKHDLGDKSDYFEPDFCMAQSWQRLIDGKNIQKHDITLLKHEIMESRLMKNGIPQSEAHNITSKKYNYSKEANEYHDRIEKHSS